MPRFVDAEQRRADILDAAAIALSEEGYGRMTLRSLAKRMGGSSTLVTHYFSTKDALVTALVERVLAEVAGVREQLVAIEDPTERVRALIDLFMPTDDASLQDEKVRFALLPYKDTDAAIGELFNRTEPSMREVIRAGLDGAVAAEVLEDLVDVVRAWGSGIVLSAVEHPEIWTPERQVAASDRFLAMLPLETGQRRPRRPARTRTSSPDKVRTGSTKAVAATPA